MPYRLVVSKELSKVLSVVSHHHRIMIIEELGKEGELDVNHLQEILGISQSRVSQHLSVLRTNRLVAERREGRHVYYHLSNPAIAKWLLQGFEFIKADISGREDLLSALEKAEGAWNPDNPDG